MIVAIGIAAIGLAILALALGRFLAVTPHCLMVADRAARCRAEQTMMPGDMPGDATHHRA